MRRARIFALVSITASAVSKIRWSLSNCACLVWLNCSEADPNHPKIISRSGEIISVNYCLFFAIRSTYVFLSLYSCGMLQILVASSFLSFIWTVKCYFCRVGTEYSPLWWHQQKLDNQYNLNCHEYLWSTQLLPILTLFYPLCLFNSKELDEYKMRNLFSTFPLRWHG